ncbi:MAG: hypothetical protein IKQ39_02170 [Oscillospiraceae bacterium]|nr:hypothetical protein [Oscillospiraceae bacterium]
MTRLRQGAARSVSAALLLTVLMLLLSAHSGAVSAVLHGRIMLCLTTLIPSLYGCTLLGSLLCMSGAANGLGRCFRHIAGLYRMPPAVFGIFLVSQLAGYPVGAMLLKQAAARGDISEQDAARLTCVCFGGGPAFLIGLAGKQYLGSTAHGVCIMLCCIAANLTVGLFLRPKTAAGCAVPHEAEVSAAQMLTQAASAAMRSMCAICAAVLLFGVLQCVLEICGGMRLLTALGGLAGIHPQTVRAVAGAFADVTQLEAVFCCGLPEHVLLPLSAGLLSFGGCCVMLQCVTVGVRQLAPGRLFCIRLTAALLSGALARICLPLLPLPAAECAAVFAQHAAVSETGSVIPAFLIFLTGFPFLLKKD